MQKNGWCSPNSTDDDTTQQIEELNSRIRELVEQESPRLVKGKMLYDEIKRDGTTSGWSNDDYKCFIDYYKAIDFAAFCRIQKRYSPKTAHNTFFLILYEMGLEDKDVRRIMGVTQEAIRSTGDSSLIHFTSTTFKSLRVGECFTPSFYTLYYIREDKTPFLYDNTNRVCFLYPLGG